jgi:hypothetical protein
MLSHMFEVNVRRQLGEQDLPALLCPTNIVASGELLHRLPGGFYWMWAGFLREDGRSVHSSPRCCS